MSKVRIIFVLSIAILLVMASMDVGGSRAYFSDTETTSVTITSWVWHDADDLVVDK